MTTRIDRAEASALVIASICISLTGQDPELIERAKAYATEHQAPVPPGGISERSLELADLAVMTMARRALEGKGQAASVLGQVAEAMKGHQHSHPLQAMVVPIPDVADGAAQSAGALALGSFLAEFAHKNPDIADRFRAWMDETRPDMKASEYVTHERIEGTDQLLTLMAHLADQVAQQHEHQHQHQHQDQPGDINLSKLVQEGHQEI
jgi:hypothetical protein